MKTLKPLYPLLLLLLIVAFFHTALAQSRVIPGNRSTTWTQAEWLKHNLQYYKLVSLDMLDSLYEVKRYTLKTQELYGVDETIEVYNVMKGGIALFSVLPDFLNESNWTAMELEDIQEAILGEQDFGRMFHFPDFSSTIKTKTMSVRLLKKEEGKYWVSNVCLLELFGPNEYISDVHPSIFNVQQGTINIRQTPISIAQMMEIYKDSPLYKKNYPFPLDFRASMFSSIVNYFELEREYLSRILEINGEQAYQFWTLTDWSSPSSYSYNRGVDRFVYMPDKGIVGGSYDFYFLYEQDLGWPSTWPDLRPRHRKTKEELWQNVIQEKVMRAEELK